MPRALPATCSPSKTQSNGAGHTCCCRCLSCFTACTTQAKAAACRWRASFEAAQGRPPSAGDMVGDAHVVQMLERRRRLQGTRLARAGCAPTARSRALDAAKLAAANKRA
jgi:hypothetical protein